MKKFIYLIFMLSMANTISACIINQLVTETNFGIDWPAEGPTWGQSFVACDNGDVWEIAFWPQWNTSGNHTLILTDNNCSTMWTVNNINILPGGSQVTVNLATGSGASRTVTSGSSYIFQIIAPANSNMQINLSQTNPYAAGQDIAANCASYGLDWWFRIGINEPLGTLPIKLSAFDAKLIDKGAAVELNFETASEIGASHFVIENSIDEGSFHTIGSIDAAGTSNVVKSYKYVHQNPLTGNNYYRLKQVDEDASFEYSKTVRIHVKSSEIRHRISPNPALGDIDIYLDQSVDNEQTYYLFNVNGEILSIQQLEPKATKISFDGSDILPGLYFIRAVENGKFLWSEKVIKQ